MNGWWVLAIWCGLCFLGVLSNTFYQIGWKQGCESGFRAAVAEKRKQDALTQMSCDRDYV